MLKEKTDDPTEVIMVVGDGGTGRRALLMYAYEQALKEKVFHRQYGNFPEQKKDFHVCIRVSFPAGISDTSIVEEIKKKLCKETSGRLLDVYSRCLVVIDSPISMTTWSKVEPELVKITGKGSKILLPGRSIHQGKIGSIINLGLHNKEESNILFDYVYKHGGRRHTTYETQEMNRIRDNIIELTDGLPLAVVILAKTHENHGLEQVGSCTCIPNEL